MIINDYQQICLYNNLNDGFHKILGRLEKSVKPWQIYKSRSKITLPNINEYLGNTTCMLML